MTIAPRVMNVADPDTDVSTTIHDWLTRFATCVREVDFAAARPFWHPDVIIFGTHQELVRGLAAWTDTQWANVWPRTEDFAFDLDNTAVLASPDGAMAVVITPWTSTGFHPEGTRFDRPGRATIVLARQSNGQWIGVHSHMSLERGVPQQSHGNRPIKAR